MNMLVGIRSLGLCAGLCASIAGRAGARQQQQQTECLSSGGLPARGRQRKYYDKTNTVFVKWAHT